MNFLNSELKIEVVCTSQWIERPALVLSLDKMLCSVRIGLGRLHGEEIAEGIVSSLLLNDLLHASFIVPELVHGQDLLAVLVSCLSHRVLCSVKVELL